MEFEVTVGRESQRFTQFADMVSLLGYWNNFVPEETVTIRKVPSDTPTLGVYAGDEIDTSDIFGRA